ncbi:hypothetical protein [Thermomicrobium sp.]
MGQTPILRPLQPNGRVTTVPRSSASAIGKPRFCNRLVHPLLALLGLSAVLSTLLVTWNERSRAITAPLLLGRFAAAGTLATDGRVILLTMPETADSTLLLELSGNERHATLIRTPGQVPELVLAQGAVLWLERPCADCSGRIRALRLATRETWTLAETGVRSPPRANGRWAAWVTRNGTDRLFVTDLENTRHPPRILAVLPPEHEITDLQLRAGRVAWVEVSRTGQWRIRLQPVASADEPVTVLQGEGTPPSILLSNDALITIDHAIRVVSLDGSHPSVPIWEGTPESVTTDGRFVFWIDSVSPDTERRAIVAYDTLSKSRFLAVPDATHVRRLAAGGDQLVWFQEHPPDDVTLWAAAIADLLPTARRAKPERQEPGWRYFPETGHYLANGFRHFWEQFGGASIFGFPLSEEFDEYDPDTGRFWTVQYFERARFVWIPESPIARDGVVLDHIGVELAHQLGLASARAFRSPAPASDRAAMTTCRAFSETGHELCGPLLDAWLHIGSSVTASMPPDQAALLITGLVISEPTVLPDGTIVQYFERARLELRPQAEPERAVSLGRIGAEILAARGWLR